MAMPSDAERRRSSPAGTLAASCSLRLQVAMNRLPPLCAKPRSSTRQHAQAQADLGADRVEVGSNASSVTLKSVTRTGTMRFLLQTNSASGASHRHDLQRARLRQRVVRLQLRAGRVDDRLQRGELRQDAELGGVGVLVRELELVGGVDLGFELDGLDRRPLEPQRLDRFRRLAAGSCTWKRAGQRVGVVLQRDDRAAPRAVSASISTRPPLMSLGESGNVVIAVRSPVSTPGSGR